MQVATLWGCFESYIGRDAILARLHHHGGSARTIEDFLGKAEAGKPAATGAMNDWSFYLGRGLAIIASIFNPLRFVLGGPVAGLFRQCEADVISNIRRNLLDDHSVPIVALSALGLERPALGGASMLHQNMLSLDRERVFRTTQPGPTRNRTWD